MTGGDSFNRAEEFAGLDFNSKRLEERFRRTMQTLSKDPGASIWTASESRSEAKAVYRMLGNDKFSIEGVLKSHRASTIERMREEGTVLAVQDTTTVSYGTRKKMDGIGYCSNTTLGVNIHSCIAVTTDGLVLGVLEQTGYTRAEAKDESMSESEKQRRPIEEKESNRWLETMREVSKAVPSGITLIHVCDREGDMYELFNEARRDGQLFLIRVVQNRLAIEEGQGRILDEIRKKQSDGHIQAAIPRDSRRNVKKREATLEIRYGRFDIKKPQLHAADKTLPESLTVNVIYVKEVQKDETIEPITWYLMTNEDVTSFESAYERVGFYMQRWKIERFHYVLKNGCKVEALQEHSMDKTKALILMYAIIAVFIMNMTYIARLNPEIPCSFLFDEEEWKILYCLANKTKVAPEKPYSIAEAVRGHLKISTSKSKYLCYS